MALLPCVDAELGSGGGRECGQADCTDTAGSCPELPALSSLLLRHCVRPSNPCVLGWVARLWAVGCDAHPGLSHCCLVLGQVTGPFSSETLVKVRSRSGSNEISVHKAPSRLPGPLKTPEKTTFSFLLKTFLVFLLAFGKLT